MKTKTTNKERRLRGHRIKSGLDELGELDVKKKKVSITKVSRDIDDTEDDPTENFVFDKEEWKFVMKRLFGTSVSLKEKEKALDMLQGWSLRERSVSALPNYVVATELLLRAVLSDEQGTCSSNLIPQLYGAVVSRVVHIMTGAFTTGSAATYRQRAQLIGFPEEAIEVRQRVAHGSFPSVSEIRWVVSLLIQFLYLNYWVVFNHELEATNRKVTKRKKKDNTDTATTFNLNEIKALLEVAEEECDEESEHSCEESEENESWTVS